MSSTLEIELRGVIPCPACGKEFVFVYQDASGHASVPCIRCRRISMVDYCNLKATLIPPKQRRNAS
jgi:phage terminase large subunit GpA-like protein